MSEWDATTLGKCFTLQKAKMKPADVDPDWPYVGLEHVDAASRSLTRWGLPASVSSLVSVFQAGDVLFGRLRPYLRKVVLADQAGVCSPEILVLRPTNAVSSEFLHLLASSDGCIEHTVSQSAGSRMPRASAASLSSYSVALPNPEEQRRVVGVMSSVDAALAALRAELRLAQEAFTATRNGLFERLALEEEGISLEEAIVEVKRPVELQHGVTYWQIGTRSWGKGYFLKEGASAADIGSKKIFWVEPGDLIINIVFAWEGSVVVVPSDLQGRCASHRFPTYRMRAGGSTDFVRHFLLSDAGIEILGLASPGGAGRNRTLNRRRLLTFSIPLPNPGRQNEVASALTAAETHLERLREEETELMLLRSTLLTALLSQSISIPESYDALLDADPSALEGAPA